MTFSVGCQPPPSPNVLRLGEAPTIAKATGKGENRIAVDARMTSATDLCCVPQSPHMRQKSLSVRIFTLLTVGSKFLGGLCFVLATCRVAVGGVRITEVCAANAGDHRDMDDEASDWIELFNDSERPANLEGWYLTDDASDLKRWRLPALRMAPHGFRVVFCSGKDRAAVDGELHTNFKLSQSGEFLGLVRPDGETIETQYAPRFPAQYAGVSYGLAQKSRSTRLLEPDANASALVPLDAHVDDNWIRRDEETNETNEPWFPVKLGIGFRASSGATGVAHSPRTDIGQRMRGRSTSVYLRIPFEVDPALNVSVLTLEIRFQGGFVAYLNGEEVVRHHLSGDGWKARARFHFPGVRTRSFELASHRHLLRAGTNWLSVHAASSDTEARSFLFEPQLHAISVRSTLSGAHRYFNQPTPGSPNARGFRGVAPRPAVSIASGTYSRRSLTVELSSSLPRAQIRYTTDGAEPTATSPLYSRPLRITTSTVLKSKCFARGKIPSPTAMRHYVLLQQETSDFSSNLPVVIVETFGRGIGPDFYSPAYLSIHTAARHSGSVDKPRRRSRETRGQAAPAERTRLGTKPHFAGRIGIKVRGSSTEGREKASYAFETWDVRGDDVAVSLLDLPADSDWILYGPYNFDRTMMRNALMYELSNRLGRYAPRTRFIEVFLSKQGSPISVEDHYVGVYVLIEKIKPGPDRVSIDPVDRRSASEPELTGGYMMKIDRRDPGDFGFYAGGQNLNYVHPKEDEIAPVQAVWIQDYVNQFGRALARTHGSPSESSYREFVEVDSCIDFHILNEFTKNPDGFKLSTYLYKPRGGKLVMGPIWDFDRTMGPDEDYRAADPVGWSDNRHYGWWAYLLRDPSFREQYRKRWIAIRQDVFAAESIFALIDEMERELSEAQERNYSTWSLWLDNGYSGEVAQLKEWIAHRLEWMDSELVESPKLGHHGGVVDGPLTLSLDNPNGEGSILYTLNDVDPKDAPNARTYGGAFVIERNAAIRARVRAAPGVWSDAVAASFLLEVPAIAISEVMYRPLAGDLYEFVELFNFGNSDVDLEGFSLRGSVSHTFGAVRIPAGEYRIIASDAERFGQRHPAARGSLVGEFEGSLSDYRGQLVLRGSSNEALFTLRYRGGWLEEAAELGHSIALRDATAPSSWWSQRDSWRASVVPGGSPGRLLPEGFGQVAGDTNQDGRFDIRDALELLHVLSRGELHRLPCAGRKLESAVQTLDATADGRLDLHDVRSMLSHLVVGADDPFPVDCLPLADCPSWCR